MVPVEHLPTTKPERDAILKNYFADWVPHAEFSDTHWRVELRPPPRKSYYVDPRISEGLAWWSTFAGRTPIRDVLISHRRRGGVQVSLSDAWTAFAWSSFLSDHPTATGSAINILHVDDHNDLMSPRLARDTSGVLQNLVTGTTMDITRPTTVRKAIESGAIGMGSFLVPFLAAGATLHIRHLRMPSGRDHAPGTYRMLLVDEPDTLLQPGASRPAVKFIPTGGRKQHVGTEVGTYRLQEALEGWVDNLPPGPVLLHIDCDYFNNRYDWDSDWRTHPRSHNPDSATVARQVNALCDALVPILPALSDVSVGLSPGFFPAEFWQPTVEALLKRLGGRRKPQRKTTRGGAIRLEPGRGTPAHGGKPGGSFWHVYEGASQAGKVWINRLDHPEIGWHYRLSIALNEASRGRGIGARAYRLAAELSGHDQIWLQMRKSNTASRRAAERAGYETVDLAGELQLLMRWCRTSEDAK